MTLIPLLITAALAKSSAIPAKREFPVNPDVNPCTNFYEYACSKVNDSFELRPDRSSHTFSFSDSNERILEYKKNYFAKLSQTTPQSKRETMLKDSYGACMNEKGRAAEEKELVATQQKTFDAITTREQMLSYLEKQILETGWGMIDFGTDQNFDRPEIMDLVIDTDSQTLPERTYYDKKEVADALLKAYSVFFEGIGLDHPTERAQRVFDFEKKLAEVHPLPAEMRELYSQRKFTTKKDLLEKYPNLRLGSLLARIPDSVQIRDMVPESLAYVNKALGELDLDTLKDIQRVFTLSPYLDDSYPKIFDAFFDLRKTHLGGPEKRPDRHERCTRLSMSRFMMDIDSILWKRMFPNFPAKKVERLAEKIRSSLYDSIQKNEWLSATAKLEASAKIKTALLQLVAPKTDEEWNFLPIVKYDNKKPIKNALIYSKLRIEKEIKDLNQPVSKLRWSMGPLTINAYYNSSYNKFVLPVGILQYPFFDAKGSDESSLGSMGMVIGHELGHGVDDQGSKFDSEGKLRTWMTEEDLKRFHERTQALEDQFNAIKHNGKFTMGENIGDLVGLTTAHSAAFPAGKKDDTKKEREFFLQYARVWCTVERPGYSEMRLKSDPHSLGYARVNEQVKHQAAFQEAFGCKAGDPMTLAPEKRIRVW